MNRKYVTVGVQAEEAPTDGLGDGAGKRGGREIVDRENLIRGFKYGDEIVPLHADHILASKPEEDKAMHILKFVYNDRVRREMYLSNDLMVVPEPGNKHAMTTMITLAQAMRIKEYVALTRFVARKGGKPKLGILIPSLKKGKCHFHWIQFPFADDVRVYEFAALQPLVDEPPIPIQQHAYGNNNDSNQINTMSSEGTNKKHPLDRRLVSAQEIRVRFDDFIQAMDLMEATIGPDGEKTEAFKPKNVYNPSFQRLFQVLKARALDPTALLPEADPRLLAGITPLQSVITKAKPALEALVEAFDLKPVEEKKRKNSMATDSDRQPDKRVKTGEDADEDYTTLSRPTAVSISRMNPVADFNALMTHRDNDVIYTAIQEMKKVITTLIESSSHFANELTTIVESLTALRDGCRIESEYPSWNEYIRSLKARFHNPADDAVYNKLDVWRDIQDAGLGLMRNPHPEFGEDVPSEDEVANFFDDDLQHDAVPVSAAAAPVDEDDEMD
ncbi:hypothetical protein SeMB42_g03803 [Synchytrium endobioticum]|nr:hypothetical protein SeMB42_g03803 [Synchytrium endobioticum]